MTGKTKLPKIDFLEACFKVFPSLNAKWLLTGEGSMWLTEDELGRVSSSEDEPTKQELMRKVEEQNEMQHRMIELLEEHVNILRREVMRRNPELAKELGIDKYLK